MNSGYIALSPEHGLNPMVGLCFFCNKSKDLVLLGRLPGDAKAPYQAVIDKTPCDECSKLMKMGVILISVDEKKSTVREHTCRRCKHVWRAPIRMSKNTTNLSGEMTETCPKCNTSHSINSSPHMLDDQNPWRTGGWVVVKDDMIRRAVTPPELANKILKQRVCFIPDEAWDLMGLPRGDIQMEKPNE